jgi:arabinoxylan arabinofuranohydrolase
MKKAPIVHVSMGAATAVALALLTVAPAARADYPIASHRYLADPGSLVLNGRVYLYNSNDDDNPVEGGYEMKSIVCVSSADLKNWTDHGVVFSVPAGASWAGDSWAPQPIERDGTVFMYFGNSGSGVGVASSKDPTGGFKDAKGSVLVNGSTPGASGTDSWLFDPGALIDSDGQAYLAFGGNGETNARIIKLGSDLASVSGSATQLAPKGFYEASFLFKRNDTYYLAYSTNPANGLRIDYLTSKSPMSGYTYGGVIADQPPQNNDNNHASEFVLGGKWYHAYHNRFVAKQAGISATYKRNLALEALDFNEDGSIKQVTYTTDGVAQVGTLNPYARVEAETMNAQSGIETETCTEGGMDVTEIGAGDWIKLRGVDFGTGAKSFSARVASTGAGGSIELHLDKPDGTLVGTCSVAATGGVQTWGTTTCDVSGASGVKDLVLSFKGATFNLNYWQFTSIDGVVDPGVGGAAGAGGGGGMANVGGGAAAGSGGLATQAGSTAVGGAGGEVHSGGASGNGDNRGGVSSAGAGSSAVAGSGATGKTDPAASNGCSCRAVGGPLSPHARLALLAAMLLTFRARRRAR